MSLSGKRGSYISEKLGSYPVVFWDFDGVIKESVDIKSFAYEHLFLSFGYDLARRVRSHHESNSGVSRFDKIPLYLSWAGESTAPSNVETFCERFSQSVMQAVIDSPWVPGVYELLLQNHSDQVFVLVTATPQHEIETILDGLGLAQCFCEVHGAPTRKADAIKGALARLECEPSGALMIGDSKADLEAAQANLVPFLLRRTLFNLDLQAAFCGPMFDNFYDE